MFIQMFANSKDDTHETRHFPLCVWIMAVENMSRLTVQWSTLSPLPEVAVSLPLTVSNIGVGTVTITQDEKTTCNALGRKK